MPVTVEEGLAILKRVVKSGETHKDYTHVCDLSKKYTTLITGKDIDKMLKQFSRREDDALFTQRKIITQQLTPSLSNTILQPFYKVGRVAVVERKIGFEDKKENEAKKADIEKAINIYCGDKSLDKYLETRYPELVFTDPNAFIVTEFDEGERDALGNLSEKVTPYPWEVSSEKAINYKYKNNILQWLICRVEIDVEGMKEKGYDYTMYLDNEAIKFTQIKPDSQIAAGILDGEIKDVQTITANGIVLQKVLRIDTKKVFLVQITEHKSGRVPAIRVGYKRDLLTEGRTFVSPIEPAVPIFMKLIKAVSEFDLTMCLHVFPQKIQYVDRCIGESPEIGCTAGRTIAGAVCKTCNGTGRMPIHTSAQDALLMRMPKDPTQMIDLDRILVYKSPPVELVKFQKEYIDALLLAAQKAVFNSDVFSRAEIAATATEKYIEMDNVYDTLFPFAEHLSAIWRYTVKIIAALRDVKDAEPIHKFPKDFKFKSVDELLSELKLANESDAPSYVKQELSKDIAMQQFQDKPEDYNRICIKEKYYPFSGKTTTEILYIISNGKTTKYNEVLWANYEIIFQELEQDAISEGKNFYDYEATLQQQKLKNKVSDMILLIDDSAQQGAETFDNDNQSSNEG